MLYPTLHYGVILNFAYGWQALDSNLNMPQAEQGHNKRGKMTRHHIEEITGRTGSQCGREHKSFVEDLDRSYSKTTLLFKIVSVMNL